LKTFAFIFARGGSKGLPGKNIMSLGGIPLIAHSILLAKDINSIERVFVSTESDEIAIIAKDYGAEIIKRPIELASDTSPEWLSWVHAIKFMKQNELVFDAFLSLPATAPLRSKVDIENCLDLFSQNTSDVVITSSPANRNPFFNMVTIDNDGYANIVIQDKLIHRRQDALKVFDMTTVAYLTSPAFILNNNSIFDGSIKSVIIPKERAIDIDDNIDFLIAKYLYEENL
jgi:CMP-N-acetylneuraminic acid synthetase